VPIDKSVELVEPSFRRGHLSIEIAFEFLREAPVRDERPVEVVLPHAFAPELHAREDHPS